MNNNTNNNNIIIITFKFKKSTEKISNFNIYKVCNKFLIIFMNPKSIKGKLIYYNIIFRHNAEFSNIPK